MSGLQPLSRFAASRCRAPDHYGFAGAMGWMPLNDTEYLLSAHHLPLSVRVVGGEPRLGVLMHPGYLARPAVDETGRWRAGYMPIALRTFPFLLAKTAGSRPSGDTPGHRPIDDLDVLVGSRLLGETGVAICSDAASGQLGPELTAIRNTLLMMRAGGARLSRALDLLTIAGVLAPMKGMDDRSSGDFTVDPQRLGAIDAGTIGTLAHESFLALDLANAMIFSRRHLSIDRLPQPGTETTARAGGAVAAPAPQADPMDFVLANLETMNFALDGSDLFDMADMEGLVFGGEPLAQDDGATTVSERAVA